jgi:hypothetical protein
MSSMIAELETLLVSYDGNHWDVTYQRILLPEPAEIEKKKSFEH